MSGKWKGFIVITYIGVIVWATVMLIRTDGLARRVGQLESATPCGITHNVPAR